MERMSKNSRFMNVTLALSLSKPIIGRLRGVRRLARMGEDRKAYRVSRSKFGENRAVGI